MGCSHSNPGVTPPADPHKPFLPREVEELQTFWDNVKRKFEEIAKEALVRLFRRHPYFQQVFPALRPLLSEQEMFHSPSFEIHAMAIFGVYDDAIANLDRDHLAVTARLQEIARFHSTIPDFSGLFFQYLEDPVVDALREKFYDQFGAHDEELIRRLLGWVHGALAAECEGTSTKPAPAPVPTMTKPALQRPGEKRTTTKPASTESS